MSNKRKHKTLALKDKIDILKKLDSGENMCKLAKEYGVGRATIHDLKKRKQKMVEHVNTMESGPGKRKTLRVGDCPKMENALYMWFMQERSKHTPISGKILKAKAIQFYQKITEKDNFRASDGWLDKFKKRFGIRLLTLTGEKLSSDESAVQPIVQRFKDKVDELGVLPDQIYNADESGLFWRVLPNKALVSCKEASASGRGSELIPVPPTDQQLPPSTSPLLDQDPLAPTTEVPIEVKVESLSDNDEDQIQNDHNTYDAFQLHTEVELHEDVREMTYSPTSVQQEEVGNEMNNEIYRMLKDTLDQLKDENMSFFMSMMPILNTFSNKQKLFFRSEVIKVAMQISSSVDESDVN